MFTKIKIRNFRAFEKIDLENLSKFNLIVGKNNSGKSSLLEAFFLLISPTNVQNPLRINSFRGRDLVDEIMWLSNFRELNPKDHIKLEGIVGKERRKLTISPNTSFPDISLAPKTEKTEIMPLNSGWIDDSTEAKINGYHFNYTKYVSGKLIHELKYSILKSTTGLAFRGVPHDYEEKLTGVMNSPSTIKAGIAARLNTIQFKKETNILVKHLKTVDPLIQAFKLGTEGFIYVDVGFETLMPYHLLGDGIIKILSVILAIMAMPNGIILIDEIENGLHYGALEKLWTAIFSTAIEYNVQIIATTHSSECIEAYSKVAHKLELKKSDVNLFRISRKKQQHSIKHYDLDLMLTAMESEWELR